MFAVHRAHTNHPLKRSACASDELADSTPRKAFTTNSQPPDLALRQNRLPEMSNCYCHPGRAGGPPFVRLESPASSIPAGLAARPWRACRWLRTAGTLGRARGRRQSLRAEAHTLPAQGKADHLPGDERRYVPCRHLRPQASPHPPQRPAYARRSSQDRAVHRQPVPVPIRLPQVRPERRRGLGDLPSRRQLDRRILRHPLDVDRSSEPRAIPVHVQHGRDPAWPAQPGKLADVRARIGESRSAGFRRVMSRHACSGRRCGPPHFCRLSFKAPSSRTPRPIPTS